MVFVPAQKSRLLLGAFSLSALTKKVDASYKATMLDSTALTDTSFQCIPGLETSTFSADGLLDMDGSATGHLRQLDGWKSGGEQPVTWAPEGFTFGNEVLLINAVQAQMTTGSTVGGIATYAANGQTDGGSDFGLSIHDLVAETASGNSASFLDNGAASSNGGVSQLHVTAFSGLTNIVIIVQHSTDHITWNTLDTFTTVTGTTQERRVLAAGTNVNRYVRALWTVTGTGSATFMAGFARR